MQKPVAQSSLAKQSNPPAHFGHSSPPQSTSVSVPSLKPLVHPRAEGASDGLTEGEADGNTEGLEDGLTEGNRDGIFDGSEVEGPADGETDGELEG
jgi:hypothetical protein